MENETITFDEFWNKFISIAERNQPYNKLKAKAVWFSLTMLQRESVLVNLDELATFKLGKIVSEPFEYLMQFSK
jgi:hypothetical protein